MAKKSTYQLKQLIPEEKPETGTKYIVRKPTKGMKVSDKLRQRKYCLLYTSPSPRDKRQSRMPSSA